MTSPEDPARAELAELWLSELGAWVPEWRAGCALRPRERRFGLGLLPAERAQRHAADLERERRRARAIRPDSDP